MQDSGGVKETSSTASAASPGDGVNVAGGQPARKEKGPLDKFKQDPMMFHNARTAPEDTDAVLKKDRKREWGFSL